jgi:hypothetical protein
MLTESNVKLFEGVSAEANCIRPMILAKHLKQVTQDPLEPLWLQFEAQRRRLALVRSPWQPCGVRL